MTLDLYDHLLEAPDGLLATLLGNLLGHVVLGLVGIFLPLALRHASLFLGNRSGSGGSASLVLKIVSVCANLGRIKGTYSLVPLEFGLQVIRGDIGLLVPHVVLCSLVDLRKLLFRGADLVGGLLRSIGSNVLAKSHGIVHCALLGNVRDARTEVCLRSFLNSPLVIMSVPRVFRPSTALLASCWPVSLSTGSPGRLASTLPAEIFWACQIKSCSSSPSFLTKSIVFAASMTLRRSATRVFPSDESSLDGDVRVLEFKAEFKAMSHCLFCGRKRPS